MSTPKVELQRCICGGEAERGSGFVMCKKCGLRTRTWDRTSDAVKDWNRIMSSVKPAPPAKPAKKPKKRQERQHHGGGRR